MSGGMVLVGGNNVDDEDVHIILCVRNLWEYTKNKKKTDKQKINNFNIVTLKNIQGKSVDK